MQIADRVVPYQKPSMYAKFSQLAVQLGCVNLGQGFPNFAPPQFLRQALSEEMLTASLQYGQTHGNPKLLQAISDFFGKTIGYAPNVNTEIVVSAGATTTLSMAFQGLVNPGEEVIVLDPSFDFYKPQIIFAQGIPVSVPVKPDHFNNNQSILDRIQRDGKLTSSKLDAWSIDFQALKEALSPKTKILLLNSPVNPTGKVISGEELDQIAKLLENYPNVIVLEDAAYQHITFGDVNPFTYARPITHPLLKHKTVCVSTAAKLFSATGLRIGFAFGNQDLIKGVKAAHIQHIFCLNEATQTATARCFDLCQTNTYFQDTRALYDQQCQTLIKGLAESRFKLNFWVPNGGYFVVTDISQVDIPEQYFIDSDDASQLTRDFAFAYYMIKEFKVVCIPCSPYYSQKELGSNLVRWAFCKTPETLEEAIKRLK